MVKITVSNFSKLIKKQGKDLRIKKANPEYKELLHFTPKSKFKTDKRLTRISLNVKDLSKFGLHFTYEPFQILLNKKFVFNKDTFAADFSKYSYAIRGEERNIRLVAKEKLGRMKPDIVDLVIYTINARGERFIYRSYWKESLKSVLDILVSDFAPSEFYSKKDKRKTELFPILFVKSFLTYRFKVSSTEKEKLSKKLSIYHKTNIAESITKNLEKSTGNDLKNLIKLKKKIFPQIDYEI